MDLILWRHADAFTPTDDQGDAGRGLSSKGAKQAQAMARWLDHRLPESARIFVSPTHRAQETAEKLGRRFVTVPNLAPGGIAAHILLAAGWPDNRHPVLAIGHQPALEGRGAAVAGTGTGPEHSQGRLAVDHHQGAQGHR